MKAPTDEALLAQDKAELRRRIGELRDAIDGPTRADLAGVIASRLAEVPSFREARAVGIYYSTGSEVPTPAMIQRLVEEEGRRAFLPFFMNGALQMTEWRPSDPVVVAPYVGFHPRFREVAPLEEIDVMVVPGLAFDRRGRRLGSGEGLYDQLLARMPVATARIGIGFQVQLVDPVPVGAEDVTLDAVVTEEGVIELAPNGEVSG